MICLNKMLTGMVGLHGCGGQALKSFPKTALGYGILSINSEGIKWKLLAWINSWLKDKKESIKVNGELS